MMLFLTLLQLIYLFSFSRFAFAGSHGSGDDDNGDDNDNENGLNGLLNRTSSLLGDASSVLGTFLGDHGTVIFQNGLLKNTSACPAMSVIFARGTAEPGEFPVHQTTSSTSSCIRARADFEKEMSVS
jgi:hypothetical protein